MSSWLYEPITWQHTDYLKDLTAGRREPTERDIVELYRLWQEGYKDMGVPRTMIEFARWLEGTGPFSVGPAAIFW